MKKDKTLKDNTDAAEAGSGCNVRNDFPSGADFVAMIGIFFLATLVGAACMYLLTFAATGMELQAINLIVYVVQFALAISGIFIYRRWRGGGGSVFHFSVKWYNASLILLGFLLIFAVGITLEPLLNLFPARYFEQLDKTIGRGAWALALTVVLAPVFEEVLFRGLILEPARQRWGAPKAILMSAVFFGLVHLPNLPQVVNAFAMGVIMGYIYVLTDSLVTVIVIHAVNNGLAYLLMEVTGSQASDMRAVMGDDRLYWIVYAVSVAVSVLSLTAMAVAASEKMRKRAEITAAFTGGADKETLPEDTAGDNNNP